MRDALGAPGELHEGCGVVEIAYDQLDTGRGERRVWRAH